MKQLVVIVIAVSLGLGVFVISCSDVENTPVGPGSTYESVASQKPGSDFKGPHFSLNVIGVPHDKLNGNFDNPKRHTIFIPLYTDWYTDPCLTSGPNSNKGDVVGEISELPSKGVRLKIGPSEDGFSVTDGNATDDKYAELLMPATPNGYDVWISGKGKPGGCLDIDAYLVDDTTYYFIGHVDVDRKTGTPKWQNAKWLLYGSGGTAYFADPNDLYFWQLYNNGLRLMQVRFYPTN